MTLGIATKNYILFRLIQLLDMDGVSEQRAVFMMWAEDG